MRRHFGVTALSTATKILNNGIWLSGVLALAYLALAWILPIEVRSIRKKLESDRNVEAYFFHWYEGQTLGTQVWLRDGGFYKLDYVGLETFAGPGNVVFWQIGDLRVSCSAFASDGSDPEFNSTHGIAPQDFAILTGDNPDQFSLYDAFSAYDQIYKRATQFPDAPSGEMTAPERPPSGLIQSGEKIAYCWKSRTDKPPLPLEPDTRMIDNGAHFYRRAAR